MFFPFPAYGYIILLVTITTFCLFFFFLGGGGCFWFFFLKLGMIETTIPSQTEVDGMSKAKSSVHLAEDGARRM